MANAFLTDLSATELKERYARVRYVFTDLDGTMMGPGSCVLKNAAGEPSVDFAATLVELARAGIEVIPCSGRNRSMLHEDTRVLGLNSYIGEMGGLIMLDREHNDWEYFTADMPFDPADGKTPHEVIEAAGVCDEFVTRWPGMLEYHNDMANGYKYREVTVGIRGEVDDAVAQGILDASGLPLDWVSNGYLNYISAPTTLNLPEGVRGRAFNIQPRGLGKGRAIERFCERRGIDPAETLSIGDASSDFLMADATAQFVLVENGLKDPAAETFLAAHDSALLTHGRTIDGWVAAMRTVLAAVTGELEA
ncbi:HAD family hydrolase [Collinsella intestinalis]|uniref:HAD family hydrolase n=1 Tax=Collinsella intestinalis TaxID=147207 RepID=UPI001959EDCA|nr:HAD hydrolase family protein [Collinsella intestinalis]MBM6683816.1 HAD hydrolase family protein [Collinsella intestinalis]